MATKTFEYTDFLEDWHNLEKKIGKNFRDYKGKFGNKDNPDAWKDNVNFPYQDFWHFFIDIYEDQIRNDTYLYDINWGHVLKSAKEDWQKEIAQYFVDEFGTENRNYWLSW